MTRPMLSALCTALFVLAGCYPDDTGTEDTQDTSPDLGPCLPVHGASGTATVTPAGAPGVAFESTGWASIVTVDEESPFPFEAKHLLARGACGTVGVLVRDPSERPAPLMYVDASQAKPVPEMVAEEAGPLEDAALFFDTDCTPVVIRLDAPDGFLEQVRGGDGTWPEPTELNPSAGIGGPPTTLAATEAWTDAEGNMHLVARATLGVTPKVVHGIRAPAPGASWTFEGFDAAPATDFVTYRADPNGGLHAAYTTTEIPCDPCDLGIYYGYLPPGGLWTETLVEPSIWNDPDDMYALDATLAVTSEGLPILAATWLERARTGATLRTELRLYSIRQSTQAWCSESVATEADTYQGERGTAFTGVNPNLVLDATDRPHVVFSDTALWYDDKARANSLAGQIRYAVRTGDGWTLATLLSQQGQTDSPDLLYGLEAPMIATSADGGTVVVGGSVRAWETTSIYNSTPKNVTFQATVVQAGVVQP